MQTKLQFATQALTGIPSSDSGVQGCCHEHMEMTDCSCNWVSFELHWCPDWTRSVLKAILEELQLLEESVHVQEIREWLRTLNVRLKKRWNMYVVSPLVLSLLYRRMRSTGSCAPFKWGDRRNNAVPLFYPRSVISLHSWTTDDFRGTKPNSRSAVSSFSWIHWSIFRSRRRSIILTTWMLHWKHSWSLELDFCEYSEIAWLCSIQ